MKEPACHHCGQDIQPDDLYLSMAGQNWTKWRHWNKARICYPQQGDSPRAEPENWEKARDLWIGLR